MTATSIVGINAIALTITQYVQLEGFRPGNFDLLQRKPRTMRTRIRLKSGPHPGIY